MRPQTRLRKTKEIHNKYKPIIDGLVREIKALDKETYTGLHGVDYGRAMVSGGRVCDLSDVLMDKEKRRERLCKELNQVIMEEMDELERLHKLQ